jgi:penicillin-binding protein 2
MSFAPQKLCFKLMSMLFMAICVAVFGLNLQAQTKKSNAKQTARDKQKNKEKQGSKDKKNDKEKLAAKADKKDRDKKEKNKKPSKAELAKQAAERREAARREEERRQAILAEQRRREQAAREARERYLAFERGLKTETLQNIANDNTEGEDLEVRRAAVNALAGHAGTVVVLEPQTGKVLTIVNQDWAIRKGFKPCSTIKLVTGVAGLSEKQIAEDGSIRGRSFPMGLDDALAHSNNSYFQKVGSSIGNQKMISYARALGLGEPTGINMPNESAGKLPYGNNGAKIYSHGEDFEVTPLQLAVMVSAISNGGKKIVPQIPRTSVEKTNFRGSMRGEVNLPQQDLQGVLPGMIGAVNYGTARRSGGTEFNAGGKTGSCIGQGSWLGLFASVAPVVNPKLAVVVITRGASERGKYASAIAGNIYRAVGYRFKQNNGNDMLAKLPLQLKPQPKVNAKTSALVDNEEGEDSDEGDVNTSKIKTDVAKKSNPKKGGDDTNEGNSYAPKASTKSRDLFEPVIIQTNRMSRPRVVPMNK